MILLHARRVFIYVTLHYCLSAIYIIYYYYVEWWLQVESIWRPKRTVVNIVSEYTLRAVVPKHGDGEKKNNTIYHFIIYRRSTYDVSM